MWEMSEGGHVRPTLRVPNDRLVTDVEPFLRSLTQDLGVKTGRKFSQSLETEIEAPPATAQQNPTFANL
jgi:hypothetical protein